MFNQQVETVRKNLRSLFPETPLQYNHFLSKRYKAHIYLKREDLSPVRSYKIRGAFNLISSILESQKDTNTEFVCASAGNHAQGFAFACKFFKVKGLIFMPVTTPKQKIEKTEVFGDEYVEIRLIGDIFDEAYKAAQEYTDKNDAVMVPPFDHPKIIEGQATVAAEICAQLDKKIDLMVLPVGGGGLSAGVSEFFKHASPETKIVCCEPAGAPSLSQNLTQKKHFALEQVDPFVDGAAVAKIGAHNYEILKSNITEPVIEVPENRLCATLFELLNHEGFVLEPAGALSIDALQDIPAAQLQGKTVVCVASGGNFDFERLPEVKERAMKYRGLKKYFILRLPQRPGALKEFLNLLGPDDDIARFEYLKKSSKNFGSILLGIETSRPENFKTLFESLDENGFRLKDVTHDEILADFII